MPKVPPPRTPEFVDAEIAALKARRDELAPYARARSNDGLQHWTWRLDFAEAERALNLAVRERAQMDVDAVPEAPPVTDEDIGRLSRELSVATDAMKKARGRLFQARDGQALATSRRASCAARVAELDRALYQDDQTIARIHERLADIRRRAALDVHNRAHPDLVGGTLTRGEAL